MSEDKIREELVEVNVDVSKKLKFISILGNWNFSALFLGGFVNNVGSYFTSIAIIFLALSFTSHLPENEATQAVVLMTTFTIAPMLLLGPIAGVLSDKFDNFKSIRFLEGKRVGHSFIELSALIYFVLSYLLESNHQLV